MAKIFNILFGADTHLEEKKQLLILAAFEEY